MWEISQTVTLYLVFLIISFKGLMLIDIDRNIRHYKEIKNSISRPSSVYFYNWLNLTLKGNNTGLRSWISRDTNLQHATFLYRNSSSSQKKGRYVLKLHLQSHSNTILTKQQVPHTINKYHTIKTSALVDLRIRWRSVSTSQPASPRLRETCWVVAGITVCIATRAGWSGIKCRAGG